VPCAVLEVGICSVRRASVPPVLSTPARRIRLSAGHWRRTFQRCAPARARPCHGPVHDIVDSSRLATALGERRWRVLLARHHAIVRKCLKRYHGNEIDNAGDGFFATFPDEVDAIRCACAVSDEVRRLGLELRTGCHVGQAEVLGKKLGGVTVHVGARVMSHTAPGEVLACSVSRGPPSRGAFGENEGEPVA
jgi:class 3 adenylate cyclase